MTKPTQGSFSWSLLRIPKDEPNSPQGMPTVLEYTMKIVVALGMLNECFNSVKNWCTKIDRLHQAMYILGFEFKS